jgi:uncharacterized membrane protein (UPF0127 family)
MRNTLIPLTIAFIADDGTIVNMADMQPQSEASHCSAKPVRLRWRCARAGSPNGA